MGMVGRRISWSLYNQTLCALRFYYHTTLGRDRLLESIPCPKEQKTLPVVLSADEVRRFLDAIQWVSPIETRGDTRNNPLSVA